MAEPNAHVTAQKPAFSPEHCVNYFLRLRSMDGAAMPDVLEEIRRLDGKEVSRLTHLYVAPERLPSSEFLAALSEADRSTCLRACFLVYVVTRAWIVPHQFQLEGALETHNGRDSIIIAGTGNGKTLCIVIPLLLDPCKITITISPLKRLQLMQVKDFTAYGIRTIAINEDTPNLPELWKQIHEGHYSHLIVQPEQFKLFKGHLPRLARLLHERTFTERIKRVHVDEAHNVYTAGMKKYGQPAFRPAWGTLDEVRARLGRDLGRT